MRIEYIKISNVLSFKYYEDIQQAQIIPFDEGLNILIGQNGSGKSTALEIINFIFKKIIFVPYNINQDDYQRYRQLEESQRKQILRRFNTSNNYQGFRLEPNWSSEDKPQKIQFKITLDEIDKRNLEILEKNKHHLEEAAGLFSDVGSLNFAYVRDSFIITVDFHRNSQTFSSSVDHNDAGYLYLTQYNYYKDLIEIINREKKEKIEPLQESFTLIGGYRNYSVFTQSVSLARDADLPPNFSPLEGRVFLGL